MPSHRGLQLSLVVVASMRRMRPRRRAARRDGDAEQASIEAEIDMP